MNDAEGSTPNFAIKHEVIADPLRLARPSGLTLTSRIAPRLGEAKDLTRDVDLVAVAEDDRRLVHAAIVVHRTVSGDVLEAHENVACVGLELGERREVSPTEMG